MRFIERLFGTGPTEPARVPNPPARPGGDTYAIERYRYMIQTAPPETLEQAHAEAFERLTPEQRRQVLAELARSAPRHEREAIERTEADDPRALARAATRAEIRQPGVMERVLGTGSGAGFGAGLLGTFAAAFAGSMVASAFFSALGSGEELAGGGAGADDGSLAGVGDADGDLDGAGDFDGADFDL